MDLRAIQAAAVANKHAKGLNAARTYRRDDRGVPIKVTEPGVA